MSKTVKNYQTLNQQLDEILTSLQAPDIDIDQALGLYEKGQKILAELELYLKSAENKVLKLNRTK